MSNPYLSLLRTAWRYARQERKQYVLVYALFVGANLCYAIYPILYGRFIDQVQRNGDVLHHAWVYASLYVALKFIEWCFHGPARIWERQLAFTLSRNFLQERYHQALHLPVKWHQDHHSGATINRIRKAYEALRAFFDGGFMYIHAISKFVFSMGAMVYFSPLYGGIGAALGLLTVWVIFKFDRPFMESQKEVNEREHAISAALFDSLSNILTVITLRLEHSMESGLLAKVNDILKPFRKNALINEWKWFAADMLVAITYAIIALGYVYQNWTPGAPFYAGGLVMLLGYVNQFTSVFHDVAWQYTQVVSYNTDVETAAGIDEAYRAGHRPEAPAGLPSDWRTLILSGLNFSHGGGPAGLHDISITLERGTRIAIIGESGCGKSTLLALLRGLYQPATGYTLTLDGRPVPLAAVNESTTLFPQEPEIFENTIAYNVTLGLPFEDAEIAQVCDTARFTSVLAQLPKGLESNIQEKGVNLSGGQKQRLALARGVLAARDSSIVLLDEPTSSVDPDTEAQIYDRMFEAFRDKVIVSSIHRLHLLPKFDYVYLMGHGRILSERAVEKVVEPSLLADLAKPPA